MEVKISSSHLSTNYKRWSYVGLYFLYLLFAFFFFFPAQLNMRLSFGIILTDRYYIRFGGMASEAPHTEG